MKRERGGEMGGGVYLGHALDKNDKEAFAQVLLGRSLGHKVVCPVPATWALRLGHPQH
jgi:hypothetical protein